MAREKYTIFDLFCGTGGFAYGFTSYRQMYRVVYANDIDPHAAATARANHKKCNIAVEDIRGVSPSALAKELNIREVDVIVGGPPCQGFSSLRPNRSASNEDERNNLYMSFASFVKCLRPKVAVLENVVGLLTHNSGDTLDRLIEAFQSLNYSIDWRILNAASYGVPQKRERFIMIAARDNAPIQFPKPTHYYNGKVIGYRDKSRLVLADPDCPGAVTVNNAISDLPVLARGQEAAQYDSLPHNAYQQSRRAGSGDLTIHKAANHSDRMMEIIKHAGPSIDSIPKHLITSGFSSCYSRLDGDQPSTTITVKFQSPASSKCIHPVQNRTITPREAARIQSFDDSFVFKGPLTQVASQLGNAVPPLLGRAIAKSVAKILR